ncbi:hypothetical protein [Azospirillum argentinense]
MTPQPSPLRGESGPEGLSRWPEASADGGRRMPLASAESR